MINLLPDYIKNDLSYARKNSQLRRWITASLLALIGMVLILIGGLIYMQYSINKYKTQVAEGRELLRTQNVEQTQKRVDEISSNTKLTVQVLSREILFSKMIRQIGASLPKASVLKTLEINKDRSGTQINAAAANFNAATQIQVNLQDPKNKVFEKADINSIDCSGSSSTPGFPCAVIIQALFSKNNSYLYIAPNTPAGAKP